jgi:hypothetical protein
MRNASNGSDWQGRHAMISVPKRLTDWIEKHHAMFTGGLVSLALIGVVLLFSSSHVLATGESAAAAGIPHWIGQLAQESLTTSRLRAQQKLEETGEAAIDPLIAALHSTNPVLRRNSAEMLGYMASPRATQPLLDSLANDPDPSVRIQAVQSLSEIDSVELAIPIEHAAVFDDVVQVRRAAADSLSAIRLNLASRAGKDQRITTAFAVAPNQPQTVYLAEMGNIAISRDGGKVWREDGSLLSRVVSLAVSPSNSELVYAGTESLGFFESKDGGMTWTASNTGLGLQPGVSLSVTALATDPQDSDRLFAAAGVWVGTSHRQLFPQGIYSSSDGGATWQALPSTETDEEITLLSFRDNKLYAVAGERVLVIPL